MVKFWLIFCSHALLPILNSTIISTTSSVVQSLPQENNLSMAFTPNLRARYDYHFLRQETMPPPSTSEPIAVSPEITLSGVHITGTPTKHAPCNCSAVYDPVCASDNNSYDNDCLMKCKNQDLFILYPGICLPFK